MLHPARRVCPDTRRLRPRRSFKEETAEIKAWAREYVRAMTPDWVPDLATPLSSFQKSVQEWADDMGVHNQHKQGMRYFYLRTALRARAAPASHLHHICNSSCALVLSFVPALTLGRWRRRHRRWQRRMMISLRTTEIESSDRQSMPRAQCGAAC